MGLKSLDDAAYHVGTGCIMGPIALVIIAALVYCGKEFLDHIFTMKAEYVAYIVIGLGIVILILAIIGIVKLVKFVVRKTRK